MLSADAFVDAAISVGSLENNIGTHTEYRQLPKSINYKRFNLNVDIVKPIWKELSYQVVFYGLNHVFKQIVKDVNGEWY